MKRRAGRQRDPAFAVTRETVGPRFGLVYETVISDPRFSFAARVLYGVLAVHADRFTRMGGPRATTIEDLMGCTAKTRIAAQNELVGAGVLKVVRGKDARGYLGRQVYILRDTEWPDALSGEDSTSLGGGADSTSRGRLSGEDSTSLGGGADSTPRPEPGDNPSETPVLGGEDSTQSMEKTPRPKEVEQTPPLEQRTKNKPRSGVSVCSHGQPVRRLPGGHLACVWCRRNEQRHSMPRASGDG
jgi:hypothetical protein